MNRKLSVILQLILLLFLACEGKKVPDLVESLAEMESGTYQSEVGQEKIKEYNRHLKLYEDQIEEEIRNTQRVALLYKRLGTNYMDIAAINREIAGLQVPGYEDLKSPGDGLLFDKIMALKSMDFHLYSKALDSIRKALEIDAANPSLFYLGGVCAGWLGKSIMEPDRQEEKDKWFATAEAYYKRALDIDPVYTQALYGLSVLLGLELERYDEAITYAERITAREKKNFEAFFLLGRLYYGLEYYEKAIFYYDKIIELSNSEEIKARARKLRETVEGRLYSGQ